MEHEIHCRVYKSLQLSPSLSTLIQSKLLLSNTHFNIILQCMPRSSGCLFFLDQNFVCIAHFPNLALHIFCQPVCILVLNES
jgi:hypothetical protein